MPYPSQVDKATVIAQAQQVIEQEGLEALSLAKLAAQLGVKAPSLYRHVGHKIDLLRAVNQRTVEQLFTALQAAQADTTVTPQAQLVAILQAFRHFAHDHPETYRLLFALQTDGERPDENLLLQLAVPLQTLIESVSGETNALAALRGALALAHGYVLLELNQQLRRGGDLDATYTQVITAYLAGWSVSGPR